jgi:hypothetical protein
VKIIRVKLGNRVKGVMKCVIVGIVVDGQWETRRTGQVVGRLPVGGRKVDDQGISVVDCSIHRDSISEQVS